MSKPYYCPVCENWDTLEYGEFGDFWVCCVCGYETTNPIDEEGEEQ